MSIKLSKTDDFIWRRMGDEIVLVGNNGLSMHMLNKTAANIWEMCDGTRSIDDIIGIICERFEVSAEEASADVRSIIQRMEAAGFVKSVTEVTGK